jgi:hypothetical protein
LTHCSGLGPRGTVSPDWQSRRSTSRGPHRSARSAERLHPARGLQELQKPLHALVDRERLDGHALARPQGVLRARTLPAGPHRHDLQDPRMVEYRDRMAREWNLTIVFGKNEEALADGHEPHPRPAGVLRRPEDTGAEGHAGRHGHPLSGDARRQLRAARNQRALYRGHRRRTGGRRGQPLEGALLLAARGRQRLEPGRSAARSCGISSRPTSRRARTSGSTRSWIGARPTSGSTSSARRSRSSTCTSIGAKVVVTAPSAAHRARRPSRRAPARRRRSSSSCATPTSPSAPDARRTRKTPTRWRSSVATGTCEGGHHHER